MFPPTCLSFHFLRRELEIWRPCPGRPNQLRPTEVPTRYWKAFLVIPARPDWVVGGGSPVAERAGLTTGK